MLGGRKTLKTLDNKNWKSQSPSFFATTIYEQLKEHGQEWLTFLLSSQLSFIIQTWY